jgi:hypothetical protein
MRARGGGAWWWLSLGETTAQRCRLDSGDDSDSPGPPPGQQGTREREEVANHTRVWRKVITNGGIGGG